MAPCRWLKLAFPKALASGCALAAFVAATAWTWRRLGSLVIDGGRELEVPRRLAEGAHLYSEVRWYWGPLAPWLNALLYRTFGVHADTLMWAGIVTAGLCCAAIYLLVERFSTAWVAAAASLAFTFGFAFAVRNPYAIFNFVMPFNFSATYGITLAIWSLYFVILHAENGRSATLGLSAVLAGLAALTKAEVGIAVTAAHVAFLVTTLPRPGGARVLSWGSGLFVAGGGYILAYVESRGAVWSSLRELANPASRFYVTNTMGLDDLMGGPIRLAASSVGFALLAFLIWRTGEVSTPNSRAWKFLWGSCACSVSFALAALSSKVAAIQALPMALFVGIVHQAMGRNANTSRSRYMPVLALALAALARIPLKVGPDHYGFYLLVPMLVAVPVTAEAFATSNTRVRAPARAAIGVFMIGLALSGIAASRSYLSDRTMDVRARRAHIRVATSCAEAQWLPWLSALPTTTRVAAIPEGAGLVFAAGLTPTTDGFTSYLPMELFEPELDANLAATWDASPPDVILYRAQNQAPVFGFLGFGHDYALEAGEWIMRNYAQRGDLVDGIALFLPRHPAH
ncbi:MAG: glycosyltransferase family 39 protein [Anaeromyxobacteraceae bacterium]